MTVTIVVAGHPVPQPRPRPTRTGGIVPPSPKLLAWRAAIQRAARTEFEAPLVGPLACSIEVTGANPRADVDNLAKPILDALEGIAFVNDRQVASLTVTKTKGPVPGARVVVEVAP